MTEIEKINLIKNIKEEIQECKRIIGDCRYSNEQQNACRVSMSNLYIALSNIKPT